MLLSSAKSYADITGPLTLNGHAAVDAFYNGNSGRQVLNGDLILKGNLLKEDGVKISARISKITGSIFLENLTPQAGDDGICWGWLGAIEWISNNGATNGSLVIRNSSGVTWESNQSLALIKKVNGDFILDNTDMAAPGNQWWSPDELYGNIEEITGDFIVKDFITEWGQNWMNKLKRIGGDFYFSIHNGSTWYPPLKDLEYVGGNFTMDGTDSGNNMWGVDFFANVEHLGGDVTIVNFPRLRDYFFPINDGHPSYAFCYVRYLIEQEIIDYACHDVILNAYEYLTGDDAPYGRVNLELVGSCYDGDGNHATTTPAPLPAKKTPEECGITSINNQINLKPAASAYIFDGYLIIKGDDLKKVELFDLTGKLILKTKKTSVPVSQLPHGVYLAKLKTSNGIQTVKVVK
jgi:hypothetical protein